MKKLIAQREIDVNEEGYLLDFNQWDKEIGKSLADEHSPDSGNGVDLVSCRN